MSPFHQYSKAALLKESFSGLLIMATLIGVVMPSAYGGESDFIFVDRMPEARGALERTLTQRDEFGGLEIVQNVFVEDYDHALVKTYVMSGLCPGGILDGNREGEADQPSSSKVFVTAIKYLPKRPATFAVATLHDIFKDVYVADRDGNIRFYEDVSPRSMLELSEAFKPLCVPV